MELRNSINFCVILFILLRNISLGKELSCSSKEPRNFDVHFSISTRANLDQDYTLESNRNLTAYDFSPHIKTAVIVHGFLMNYKAKSIINMKNAFLQTENMNVITVDWSQGCNKADDYVQAVTNTQTAAAKIENFFIKLINSHKGTSVDKWGPIHFVGHSLGAHTVGQAANLLKNNKIIINRVTGLDPAQPCFKDDHSPMRLKASVARFVDVIHTNGGNGIGLFEPIGHVDFYVNGGKKQPGCPDFDFTKFSMSNPTKYSMADAFCHHNRAVSLFTQSLIQKVVKQCHFWSQPWNMNERINRKITNDSCKKNKCLEMGINAHDVDSRVKTFFVPTTEEKPYCNIH